MALLTTSELVGMGVSAEPGDGTDGLLTATEAAAYLRVSRATLWRWCQAGMLPAFKIGREWRIVGPALERLVAADASAKAPHGQPGAA